MIAKTSRETTKTRQAVEFWQYIAVIVNHCEKSEFALFNCVLVEHYTVLF